MAKYTFHLDKDEPTPVKRLTWGRVFWYVLLYGLLWPLHILIVIINVVVWCNTGGGEIIVEDDDV